MYRRTKKYSAARQQAMQHARAQRRMDDPAPDYPAELPQVRMRITVERFDLATPERHEFELRAASKMLGHAGERITAEVYRRAGEKVNPTR